MFALIVSNLEQLYIKTMTSIYQDAEARKQARVYFRMIYKAARAGEPDAAEAVTRRVMLDCINNREVRKSKEGVIETLEWVGKHRKDISVSG